MEVKKKNRGRPSHAENKLSAQQILDRVKSLLKEEGKIPSVRRLAKNLSVDPMAIYHYYVNKKALLEALVISLMQDIYQPLQNRNWEVELEKLSKSYLELLSTSPGLLEIMLAMNVGGPASVFNEKFDIVVSRLKLSDDKKQDILNLLIDYLHGFSLSMSCNPNKDVLPLEQIDNSLTLITALMKHEAM